MKEIEYCKYCKKEITESYPKCCIHQIIFNNFTGEFNRWDEIEKLLEEYKNANVQLSTHR